MRPTRGETLVETLVAMLVVSLSLMMLATAIASASGIALRSGEAAKTYFAANNSLVSEDKSTPAIVTVTSGLSDSPQPVPVKFTQQTLPGQVVAVSYEGV